MGTLGFTEFCKNGHITKSVLDHEIDTEDDVLSCPYCGANEFVRITEWGDHEYDDGIVPIEPIDYIWVDVNNDWFIGKKKIAVYDVSGVKEWNKGLREPGECKWCYAEYSDNGCLDCPAKEKRLKYGLELIKPIEPAGFSHAEFQY